MKNLIYLAAFALAVTFASTLAAQDTTTTETTDEAFPVGTDPDLQPGQSYLLEKHGDWDVVCVKAQSEKDSCHIFQSIKDETGNPVAEMNLFLLPPGNVAVAGATVITPLRTLLTAQVVFGIDGGAPKQYPFNWCETQGCVSRVGFTGPELDALKSGSEGTLTIQAVDAPGANISLRVSLSGFTAALAKSITQ